MQEKEYEKLWSVYCWMLNNNWERKKAFDEFSFSIVKLFTTLNSSAIAGLIVFALSDVSNLANKKNILIESIEYWIFGIVCAFVCLLFWYFIDATSLDDAEKTYEKVSNQINKKEEPTQKKGNVMIALIGFLAALIIIATGMGTGIFFIMGAWNLISII